MPSEYTQAFVIWYTCCSMSNEHAPTAENSSATSIFETARGVAVKLLSRYESSDSYIDKLLDGELRRSDLKPADRALVTELVNGCVRWQSRIDWILTGFYHGEFAKCLPIVKNSLRIALYQMLFLSKIPASAAINESVEIVKSVKGDRHAGIVNGVLRNILRNVGSIRYPSREENEALHIAVHSAHPQWMVRRYIERLGAEETEALLNANNNRPMVTLRVNTMRTTRAEVEQQLSEAGIKYEVSPIHAGSLMMTSLRDVRTLTIFTDGSVTVQDSSASLAVQLANPKPGMTVYDLCAAPGGKAVHAAELMNNEGRVVALELYESKLAFIQDNATRSGITIIEPVHGDALEFEASDLADLVLVDAPCTGLGTLSKKPDIKWRRTLDDVRKMSIRQGAILSKAAELVKVGGAVVYSTCTIEPEENVGVVAKFLDTHKNYELEQATTFLPDEVCTDGFLQTFPHKHSSDGAFAARLKRIS